MSINSVVWMLDFILLNIMPLECTLINIPRIPTNWQNPAAISVHKRSPSLSDAVDQDDSGIHGGNVVWRMGEFNSEIIAILL